MKFVHIADIHFDMPFTVLNKNGFAEKRRLDQRKVFEKVINYIQENNVDFLFIAGDLYENEYVRKSTIDYINNCFKQIPNTKIFITPGNHDPYLNNSYYNQYKWNENVKIFTDLEKVSIENINVYGYGFTSFYSKKIRIPNDLESSKINILLMHADLNGTSKEFGEYNPILESELKNSDFDYIALGHIHKSNIKENKKIVYPGSLISGGFDELGRHGMVVGEIDLENKKIQVEFIPLDNKEFIELEFATDNINSKEELIENINKLKLEDDKYYKIILTGKKQIDIDTIDLLKNMEDKKIIKIKDKTSTKYNLEKISKEQTLKGIFVKELLSQINNENEKQILESINIGLEFMK